MLKQLTVTNVGLVRQIDLDLGAGLTVLTGESGAGKSLLLAALGLVLGERAQAAVLRQGSAKAEVCAEFDLRQQPELLAALTEQGLEDADGEPRCLLRRTVTREGRSRAFINDSPVTQAALRSFADQLVDIHGQHDSYRLGDREVQRALLDDFGCRPADLAATRQHYRAWATTMQRHRALIEEQQNNNDRRELLRYQLDELDQLDLKPGEFAALETQFRRAAQAQQLMSSVQQSLNALEADAVGDALRPLRALHDDDDALAAAVDCLQSAQSLLEDGAQELRSYLERIDSDAGEAAAMEQRLSAIHDAARKHKVAPEQLETHIETLRETLEGLSRIEHDVEATGAEAQAHRSAFERCGKKLSQQRRKAAKRFGAAVTEHMQLLGIGDGALSVRWIEQEGEHGLEGLEFHIVTNANAQPAPLKQVASGGEQARISLAIAIVAAASTALPCLVLDEADVGVGGITADTVGRLLRRLAEHSQVLCITHAPQVAALGQQHLRVFKNRAGTGIESLDGTARQEEIARMLAGAEVTGETRAYASTLLAGAESA